MESSPGLHRELKARHISMIACGGALGTGLLIGTGVSLANAGPLPLFVSYAVMGAVVYCIMTAVGELASHLPIEGGFAGYASRFVHPSLGFAVGYCYLALYLLCTPNQLTAAALIIQYWVPRETVNPAVFITIAIIIIFTINLMGIKSFGEFEFYMSSFKVLIVCGLIIFCLTIAAGAGNHPAGFQYWVDPGVVNAYKVDGMFGEALAFIYSFVVAVFAYIGTELVGVAVCEVENPRAAVPRAIRLTLYRIVTFYIVLVFLLGLILPYNSPDLIFATKHGAGGAASPFVVAMKLAGIQVLPSIFNGCILIFIISAANSDLYIASRTLFANAVQSNAHPIFTKTNSRGVPVFCIAVSFIFSLLSYMNVCTDSALVFNYFVNVVTMFGLLTWMSILYTHIRFMKACQLQRLSRNSLPFKAPFGAWGSWISLIICGTLSLLKGIDTVIGEIQPAAFVTNYLGIFLFALAFVIYKYCTKTTLVDLRTADLVTGSTQFVEAATGEAKASSPWKRIYNRFIGLCF